VYGINITANSKVIEELKKYCKGFFFVRQKRMPLTLCQGITVGLDNESKTPTLPTIGDVLVGLDYNKSFVETEDINGINFISEGFLSRYYFKIEKKEKGTWAKIGIVAAITVAVAAAVVATIFTCGAAGAAVGAGIAIAAAAAEGAALVAASITTVAIVTGVTIGVGAAAFGIRDAVITARQNRDKEEAQAINGRNEEIPEDYERKE
jgi:hypothetical protein